MITLSILRHAKSSWDYPDLVDIDRPILNKGVRRTLRICDALNERKSLPDRIISSPAKRAIETADIIIEKLNLPLQAPEINEHFYPGYARNITNELIKVNSKTKHLMIVGHNPGLTELVYSFVKEDYIDWIPTSGLVQIHFNCNNWNDISHSNATLLRYLTPKQLKPSRG